MDLPGFLSCLSCYHYDDDVYATEEEEEFQEILDIAQFFHRQGKSVEECREYIMDHFHVDNLDCSQCRFIDNYSYNKGGEYWLCAYDFPQEDDVIDDKHNRIFIGLANNVGIFTFNIVGITNRFDS